jgi:hypothetical protein
MKEPMFSLVRKYNGRSPSGLDEKGSLVCVCDDDATGVKALSDSVGRLDVLPLQKLNMAAHGT